MTTLPPELAAFSYLLDAQPSPVREAFHYCLCVLMVEAGKMRLVEKVPGEHVCVFATTRGERFSMVEPKMSKVSKAALIDVLREIFEDEL
jgi:hypothetical protein